MLLEGGQGKDRLSSNEGLWVWTRGLFHRGNWLKDSQAVARLLHKWGKQTLCGACAQWVPTNARDAEPCSLSPLPPSTSHPPDVSPETQQHQALPTPPVSCSLQHPLSSALPGRVGMPGAPTQQAGPCGDAGLVPLPPAES